MKLYHITPRRNFIFIMKEGLIPGRGKGITANRPRAGCVFLTNNVEQILKEQCGQEWIKNNNPLVLEINTEHYNIRPLLYTCYDVPVESNFEFICNVAIAPDHIVNASVV